MSDYISLEELRALSRGKLMARLEGAQFPFECASCSLCVTMHKYIHNMCDHEDFKREASHLSTGIRRPSPEQLRANLPEIYALRMFHRDLYPSTPEPPVMPEQGRGVLVAK